MYQRATLSDLRTSTNSRVGSALFYADPEIDAAINEALKIWNLFTGQWNGTESVATTSDTIFYSTTLVTNAVTDQNLLNEMQYHMMETANSGSSMTSDIWTLAEVQRYLNDRHRQLIGSGKLILAVDNSISTVIGTASYDLNDISDKLVDIHRVAWVDASGNSFGLARVDELQSDLLDADPANATPKMYSLGNQANLTIELIPAPVAAGTLHVTYSDQGTDLANTGVAVNVPDDFSPYVKWGMMADMLYRDGQANDPTRAEYCYKRFQEGLALAKTYDVRRRVLLGTAVLEPTSMWGLDWGKPQWQSSTSTPTRWFPVGAKQIGIYPAHNAGGGTLNIEGQKSAPKLVLDGDFVDLSEQYIGAILDYVQHIMAFKQSGSFTGTLPLLRNFLSVAQRASNKLAIQGLYREHMGMDLDQFYRGIG